MATCNNCFHYDVCKFHIDEETNMTVDECAHGFVSSADVMKARHGEWIYDSGIGAWHCSECECKNDNLGTDSNSNPYSLLGSNFCPHCSTRMTGGEESD
ncbi:MAG: hypothetical protein IKL10_04815 [Clostridia bacterium]|nr:hypothetical protein [Clostridia bacterium]